MIDGSVRRTSCIARMSQPARAIQKRSDACCNVFRKFGRAATPRAVKGFFKSALTRHSLPAEAVAVPSRLAFGPDLCHRKKNRADTLCCFDRRILYAICRPTVVVA